MSRAEFASLYLPKEQGAVDYSPLATPQVERARLCHLTGLNGQLEASVSQCHMAAAEHSSDCLHRWLLHMQQHWRVACLLVAEQLT